MDVIHDKLLPDQAVSYKEKAANDFKIMKETAKYYKGLARFSNDLEELYGHANGTYFEKSEYTHLSNPFGLNPAIPEEADLLDRGTVAEIRNYPIIKPMIDLHMGEKRRRKRDFTVVAINSDAKSRKRDAIMAGMLPKTQQGFINNVNQLGMVQTGVPNKAVGEFTEEAETIAKNYTDERAVVGQHAVNVLDDELDLASKEYKKFYHYIVSGKCISYKTVYDDEVCNEVIDPKYFWHLESDDLELIEDTEAQCRKIPALSRQDILMQFQWLDKKEINAIKEKLKEDRTTMRGTDLFVSGDMGTGMPFPDGINKESESGHKRYTIFHIVWRSVAKMGILTYENKLGMEDIMNVDDSYEMDKEAGDIDIEWKLIPEYWECYNIEGYEDLYFGCRPLTIQRNKFNGKGAKSCYNGRCYSNIGARNTSLVKLGIPFQKKVNEYHYYLDRTMGKNNDKIILMDKNSIPNNSSISELETMYYAKEHGFLFVDMQQKGASKFNNWTVLDATYTQYVITAFELIARWTELYHQVIGVNPQRMADIANSAGKGTTQEALQASYTMSEELFAKFDDMELKDMQGNLDISKFAWRKGKSRIFKGDDGRDIFFEIDPEDYQEAEYQVYIKNGNKERENLTQFRQLMLSIIQNSGPNGADPALIARLMNAESMAVIEKLTAEFMELQKKVMAEQAQAAQQAQAAETQAEQEDKQAERDLKRELKQMEIDAKNEASIREAQALMNSAPIPADTGGAEVAKLLSERQKAIQTNAMDLEKLEETRAKRRQDSRDKNRELDIKEKQINAQKYVAKVNKN